MSVAGCECIRCLRERADWTAGFPTEMTKMILCPECGNKRCPKASDHRNACTGSNEPGQPGSVWENVDRPGIDRDQSQ